MTGKLQRFVTIIWLPVLVASCTFLTPAIRETEESVKAKAVAMQELGEVRVDTINIDYRADCKARIKNQEKSYSGSCQLILTRQLEMQLTVSSPLGGTVLKIYADAHLIQLNDYSEKQHLEFKADDKRKLNIPIIKDLSMAELQSILWGRLTKSTDRTLQYERDDDKLLRLFKSTKALNLRVDYQKWLEYEQMMFPQILEITNLKDGASIKLAITRFDPGFVSERLYLDQPF